MAAAIYSNDGENVTSARSRDLKASVPSCWRRNKVILMHLNVILSQSNGHLGTSDWMGLIFLATCLGSSGRQWVLSFRSAHTHVAYYLTYFGAFYEEKGWKGDQNWTCFKNFPSFLRKVEIICSLSCNSYIAWYTKAQATHFMVRIKINKINAEKHVPGCQQKPLPCWKVCSVMRFQDNT